MGECGNVNVQDDQLDEPGLRDICSKFASFVDEHSDKRITDDAWWVTVDGFLDRSWPFVVFDLEKIMALTELCDVLLEDEGAEHNG